MQEIIIYALQSCIVMTAMYFVYFLFLRKETYFGINRIFLLLTFTLPFLIPSFQFNIQSDPQKFSYILQEVVVNPTITKSKEFFQTDYWQIFFGAYAVIVILLLMKLLYNITKMLLLIKNTSFEKIGEFKIAYLEGISSFSFFNNIFINKNTDFPNVEKVVIHEKSHAMQKHSIDILLAELVVAFQWFNPFAWYSYKALKQTHEFLADEATIAKGIEQYDYSELLLSEVLNARFNQISNNFNHSLIKRRIQMITKSKSSTIAKFKILLSIPVIAASVWLISCSNENKTSDASAVAEVKTTANQEVPSAPPAGTEVENNESSSKVYSVVETMPEFKGGQAELGKFFSTNVKYPENALKKNIQGKVFVGFVVTSNGKVANVSLKRGVNPELDKEALRVVALMDGMWIPGKDKGKQVDVELTIPVNFSLK
ncbi:MAG: M56 family metallopeptidase [Bacteroidota bacterium]